MKITTRLLKPIILAVVLAFLATSSSCIVVDKNSHSRSRHPTRVQKSPKHFHKHCHRRGKRGKNLVCHNHAHRHPHH